MKRVKLCLGAAELGMDKVMRRKISIIDMRLIQGEFGAG
jgi:hypothetical protein